MRIKTFSLKSFFLVSFIFSLCVGVFDQFLFFSGGSPFPYTSIAITIFLATLYLFLEALLLNNNWKVPTEILSFFLIMQVSVVGIFINGFTYDKMTQFIRTDLNLFSYVVFVFLIINLLNKNNFLQLLKWWEIVGCLAAFIGILQFITIYFSIPIIDWGGTPFFRVNIVNADIYGQAYSRVASFFQEPSWFAYFLLDFLGIIFAFVFINGAKREWLAILFFIFAFFICGSMSGFISLGLFVFLFLKEFGKLNMKKYIYIVVFTLMTMAILLVFVPFLQDLVLNRFFKIFSFSDPSTLVRFDSIFSAIRVWFENSIFGVGLGNASIYVRKLYSGQGAIYYVLGLIPENFKGSVDSVFFLILAENGLIGIGAFIFMMYKVVKNNTLKVISEDSEILRKDGIMYRVYIATKFLKLNVIRNFVELFFQSGNFMFPRLWLNIGVYLALKRILIRIFEEKNRI